MADIIPHYFLTQLSTKKIDFNTDGFKAILCNGSYVEATLRDIQTYADVSANEITSGNGYVTGGIDVSGTSATTDDANNRTLFKCDDLVFTATGGEIGPTRYCVMYDSDGEDTTVYVFDFGEDKTVCDGATLRIVVDATAFMKAYQKV